LAVGRIRRPHGIAGELLMEIHTDFPERLVPGRVVFVGPERTALEIKAIRLHVKSFLVSFAGVTNREQAAALRNQWVSVRTDGLEPLPDGDYYHHQIIGLRVLAEDGRELGSVVEILETGANDVYIVRSEDGKEILLPATDDVTKEIDLQAGEMQVELLPGLLPD
jgi:16S rRNA processing protein RimM